jgi:hypothetical protein
MNDVLFMIGSELAEELQRLLPEPYYAEFRRADATLSSSWQYNRVWVLATRPNTAQVEITLRPDQIALSLFTSGHQCGNCSYEYEQPGCIELIIQLILQAAAREPGQ